VGTPGAIDARGIHLGGRWSAGYRFNVTFAALFGAIGYSFVRYAVYFERERRSIKGMTAKGDS
jgi:hypothetical protein